MVLRKMRLKKKYLRSLKGECDMYNVYDIRKQFPMLNHDKKMQGEKLVFLDNCSTTFKPQCVINEITRYYTDMTSNSHRGDYDLCYNMGSWL